MFFNCIFTFAEQRQKVPYWHVLHCVSISFQVFKQNDWQWINRQQSNQISCEEKRRIVGVVRTVDDHQTSECVDRKMTVTLYQERDRETFQLVLFESLTATACGALLLYQRFDSQRNKYYLEGPRSLMSQTGPLETGHSLWAAVRPSMGPPLSRHPVRHESYQAILSRMCFQGFSDPDHDRSHISEQIEIFAFTGMNADNDGLTHQYHNIYLTRDGRISIAGLNEDNLEYVATAIHSVTDGKSIAATPTSCCNNIM